MSISVYEESICGAEGAADRVPQEPIIVIHDGRSVWRIIWALLRGHVAMHKRARVRRIDITYGGS